MNAKQQQIIHSATKVRGAEGQYAIMFAAGEEGVLVFKTFEHHDRIIVKADTGAIVGLNAFTVDYFVDGVWITGRELEQVS